MSSRSHRSTLPRTAPRTLALAGLLLLLIAGLTPLATAQPQPAAVALADQVSDGHTVVVERVALPAGGFVVVHDQRLQNNDSLASVVGASDHLDAGVHENVTVQLDEPLLGGQTLFAMAHRDTDTDRTFDFVASGATDDGPYLQNGTPVQDRARVNGSADVTFPDQPTDGRWLVLDRVALARPGFVAFHDSSFLEEGEGSPLGTSAQLPAGVVRDLRVALDEPLEEATALVAVPMVNGSATDDGEARPFSVDGEPVVGEAVVRPSSAGNVTFSDQRSGGAVVVVGEAFLPEGGFVAVHDRTLDEGMTLESLRGNSTCLSPGLHRDLRVPLDPALNASDNMTAVLHRDTNDDCTFDFVTSDSAGDGPYADRRGIVRDQARVDRAAAVTFGSQPSDGHTVVVPWADLSDGGFLVAHDPRSSEEDPVAGVVGHSDHLDAGLHENVTIELREPLRSSQQLSVVAHRDTDRDRTFALVNTNGTDDGPYLDSDGDPVSDADRVRVLAVLVFHTQATRETVTVDSVTLHEGGFVALHDGPPLDANRTVLGHSDRLAPGTHANVTLSLDPRPEGNATLVAAVHHDTNETGSFEFVTSNGTHDRPYRLDGGTVSVQAQVTFLGESPPVDVRGHGEDPAPNGSNASNGSDGTGDGDGEGGTEAATKGSPTPAPGLAALLALVAVLAWARRRH